MFSVRGLPLPLMLPSLLFCGVQRVRREVESRFCFSKLQATRTLPTGSFFTFLPVRRFLASS